MKVLTHFFILTFVTVLFAGAYGWWYATIAGESAAIAEIRGDIAAKKESADRASAVKTALTDLENDEAAVEAYFIGEADIAGFPGKLEALGKTLGTEVDINSIGEEKSTTRPAWTVSLLIKGPFDAVARTMGAIEFAPYDLRVSSATFSSESADTKAVWSAQVTLSVGRPMASSVAPATAAPKASSTPSAPPSTKDSQGTSANPTTL